MAGLRAGRMAPLFTVLEVALYAVVALLFLLILVVAFVGDTDSERLWHRLTKALRLSRKPRSGPEPASPAQNPSSEDSAEPKP